MRRISFLLALIVLPVLVNLNSTGPTHASALTRQEPRVTGARLKGKKLIVSGENFSGEALIVVDGVTFNTRSDSDNPSGVLIAKKAGKRIAPDKIVTINVMNNTGRMSPVFDLFSGLVLTIEDAGKTINLKVGDKFQVFLEKEGYTWTVDDSNTKLISHLVGEPLLPGAQGVFQATQAGTTQLSAIGELPCHQSTPPCSAPTLGFQVTLVIQDVQ